MSYAWNAWLEFCPSMSPYDEGKVLTFWSMSFWEYQFSSKFFRTNQTRVPFNDTKIGVFDRIECVIWPVPSCLLLLSQRWINLVTPDWGIRLIQVNGMQWKGFTGLYSASKNRTENNNLSSPCTSDWVTRVEPWLEGRAVDAPICWDPW